jgi:hypothetical protein
MDDIAAKFLNVRPLKYERSPLKNPDSAIRSLKNVKTKHPIKCESQKDGVFCDETEEIPSEKVSG